jgi:hypothetical protein
MVMEMMGMQRLVMEMMPDPPWIPMVVKIGALLVVPLQTPLRVRFLRVLVSTNVGSLIRLHRGESI